MQNAEYTPDIADRGCIMSAEHCSNAAGLTYAHWRWKMIAAFARKRPVNVPRARHNYSTQIGLWRAGIAVVGGGTGIHAMSTISVSTAAASSTAAVRARSRIEMRANYRTISLRCHFSSFRNAVAATAVRRQHSWMSR